MADSEEIQHIAFTSRDDRATGLWHMKVLVNGRKTGSLTMTRREYEIFSMALFSGRKEDDRG